MERSVESAPANVTLAQGSVAPAVQKRSIIQTGTLVVRTEDLEMAEKDILAYVRKYNGFVQSSQSSNLEGPIRTLNFTLRIPVQKFEEALTYFSTLGVPVTKSVVSEDITAQIVDLDARLKVMRAQEESYLNILKQSKVLKDSITVQDRLMQLRADIESMDSQLRAQRELAALSTINLSLTTSAVPVSADQSSNWANNALVGSLENLRGVGQGVGAFLIFLLVMTPLWAPIAILVWWLLHRRRKERTNKTA